MYHLKRIICIRFRSLKKEPFFWTEANEHGNNMNRYEREQKGRKPELFIRFLNDTILAIEEGEI